jgi:hypothetical protein
MIVKLGFNVQVAAMVFQVGRPQYELGVILGHLFRYSGVPLILSCKRAPIWSQGEGETISKRSVAQGV